MGGATQCPSRQTDICGDLKKLPTAIKCSRAADRSSGEVISHRPKTKLSYTSLVTQTRSRWTQTSTSAVISEAEKTQPVGLCRVLRRIARGGEVIAARTVSASSRQSPRVSGTGRGTTPTSRIAPGQDSKPGCRYEDFVVWVGTVQARREQRLLMLMDIHGFGRGLSPKGQPV
ncbi:hypothetical protein Z951_43240 [Streptomyces sp. PRh5]|nr:hypothetical protein Z951_43240 [Streptomyces sp. PRh5]